MSTITRSNSMRTPIIIGAVSALMLNIASIALASAAANNTRSIMVSYGELDISRPVGAQVLYQRIVRAATAVCDDFTQPYNEMRTRKSTCFKDAVANAVAKVNSEQLFAIHRAHMTQVASN
jgi:UrcA family protein